MKFCTLIFCLLNSICWADELPWWQKGQEQMLYQVFQMQNALKHIELDLKGAREHPECYDFYLDLIQIEIDLAYKNLGYK